MYQADEPGCRPPRLAQYSPRPAFSLPCVSSNFGSRVPTRFFSLLINIHLPFCIILTSASSDHFDQDVEGSLRRDLPIITTPHAKDSLTGKAFDEVFQNVYDLDFFEYMMVILTSGADPNRKVPRIKVTGMPGKHVPPGVLGTANDILHAVPPTTGWMVELGYGSAQVDASDDRFASGYRIYISGDTLMVDELKAIPEHLRGQNVDLGLIHVGEMTISSPSLSLLMATMDARQGVELGKLVHPDLTIPIHFDDYDVFLSPLEEFKGRWRRLGWGIGLFIWIRGGKATSLRSSSGKGDGLVFSFAITVDGKMAV